MMFQPPDKPIFSWGTVDVTLLDKEEKCLGLVVHVYCFAHELHSDEVKSKCDRSVKAMLKYLVDEEFVSSMKGWNVAVAVMGHNPKE